MIEVEQGSANVYDDLGLPDAAEMHHPGCQDRRDHQAPSSHAGAGLGEVA